MMSGAGWGEVRRDAMVCWLWGVGWSGGTRPSLQQWVRWNRLERGMTMFIIEEWEVISELTKVISSVSSA